MFFASIKITRKRVVVFHSAAIILIMLTTLFYSALKSSPQNGDTKALRTAFLSEYGIDISSAEERCDSITMPESDTDAFRVFKSMQKQNGFDASPLVGKTLVKHSYLLETENIVASVYVLKGNIVGTDLFCLDTFRYIPISEFGDL